ncbi:MAG: hypothetical protein ABF633_02925 [Clostridium sp.]|uniref:hypothetical protein n=1 Tax=Clostridium sp. TaxID=1506 RepID=UPI0039E769DB
MIDKETFRKTEKKLYNYFKKDKKINSLKQKITLLNKHIDQIEYKLKHTDISIPEESKSMTFEERVQTSSTGESYAERTALRITDRLIKEESRKFDEISEIEEEIRNIEADNIIIEENIKLLRKEDIEFLKSKYDKELPDWEVGLNLNMSQSKVTRKRQRLVDNIANWEAWTKIVH